MQFALIKFFCRSFCALCTRKNPTLLAWYAICDARCAICDMRRAAAAAANEINKSKRALNEGYEGDYAHTQIDFPDHSPKIKGKNGNWNIIKTAGRQGSRRERGGEVGSLLIPLAIAFIQFALIQMNSRTAESEARQLLSLCAYLLCNLALPNFRLLLYWYWLMAVWAALSASVCVCWSAAAVDDVATIFDCLILN